MPILSPTYRLSDEQCEPLQDLLPNGVHQVRLAQTHAAVNEKRVVSFGGRLGNGQGRRVCKLIV